MREIHVDEIISSVKKLSIDSNYYLGQDVINIAGRAPAGKCQQVFFWQAEVGLGKQADHFLAINRTVEIPHNDQRI